MALIKSVMPTPPTIHDVRRSVVDPVQVLTNGSYEYRVRRQRFEKFKWEIPTQTMSNEDKETFRAFFSGDVSNGLNSFYYEDEELSTIVDAPVVSATLNGYYPLMFPLKASGVQVVGTHPVFMEVDDPTDVITVYYNGAPVAGGDWSYEMVNGLPNIYMPSFVGAAGDVTYSGTVYFPVRLDSSFSDVLTALDCTNTATYHTVNSIKLVEVFGEQ